MARRIIPARCLPNVAGRLHRPRDDNQPDSFRESGAFVEALPTSADRPFQPISIPLQVLPDVSHYFACRCRVKKFSYVELLLQV